MTEPIIIAVLSSGVISALIASATTLIVRHLDRKDSQTDKIAEIEKKVKRNEVDNVRLQMMLLMSDYPEEKQEIMRCAEHYFKELHGNWYMSTLFQRWLNNNSISNPEWFKERSDSNE